jgi:hypothetical protein
MEGDGGSLVASQGGPWPTAPGSESPHRFTCSFRRMVGQGAPYPLIRSFGLRGRRATCEAGQDGPSGDALGRLKFRIFGRFYPIDSCQTGSRAVASRRESGLGLLGDLPLAWARVPKVIPGSRWRGRERIGGLEVNHVAGVVLRPPCRSDGEQFPHRPAAGTRKSDFPTSSVSRFAAESARRNALLGTK